MPRSLRRITPRTTLDGLKKEAKRWLKALRANDPAAHARFVRAARGAPAPRDSASPPTLRRVQLALAREHDLSGWAALTAAVAATRFAVGDHHGSEDAALNTLLRAAGAGDTAAVAAVLDARPDLASARGAVGPSGLRSALHFAVGGSHEHTVNLLLDRGADPNVRDQGDNALPLHFAAEKGDEAIIHLLVEHGSDTVGAGDDHDLEVIGWATVFGSAKPDIVNYLLAHGARHNIASAVATGDAAAIRAIAAADRTQLDRIMDRANQHRRPLHLAVVKRQRTSLETLLGLGADTEARDAAGLTALDQAALDGAAELAQLLIDRGARVTLPAALGLDRPDDARRLLAEIPGALVPGGECGTLIVRAAERGSAALIDALVRGGAAVDVEDDTRTSIDGTSGYTALHAAAWNDNVPAARALLARGASVTVRDSTYCGTPVGWAAYAGKRNVLVVLLQGDIDIFDAIEHGRLARVRAIVAEDPAALNRTFGELLRPNAPPPRFGYRCKPWWTPLSFAAALRRPDAVRLLHDLGARADPALVERFLDNACPDHHVRGGADHVRARTTAVRLLERYPEIAYDGIHTGVVCGDAGAVRAWLTDEPTLASASRGAASERRAGGGSNGDLYRNIELGPKGWTPLLYLCFTRLELSGASDNAVDIARMLLDHGADPNVHFMAGGSRYTPLVGAIGEGEEDRPPHPKRDELVRLLLERDAEQYDIQVIYDIHFHGDVLWFLELIHERSLQLARAADWNDPVWSMLDMGGYGSGARWHLDIAVRTESVTLARWCLEHGANPNAAPPRDPRLSQRSLYEQAVRAGESKIAELLAQHGASCRSVSVDDLEAFTTACLRLDEQSVRAALTVHPELAAAAAPLHEAAKRNRADVVRLLLDLGVSPDVSNERNERALHQAAYAGALDVAELLIEYGAEIDPVESQWGNTPPGAAVYAQQQALIDVLADYSEDVWVLTNAGKIDRLRALLREHPERARVESGGHTLLMRLPTQEEALALATATLLLAHGADPALRNKDGMTAADRAEKLGLFEVAELLRRPTGESAAGR